MKLGLCNCVTQLELDSGEKLSSSIFYCLSVSQSVSEASVSPDQISTFSNVYRHTSPMLTLYHVIPSSASFYWPRTTKYQTVSPYTDPVPAGTTYNSSFLRHTWIISPFMIHLMSHAQYTWSSLIYCLVQCFQKVQKFQYQRRYYKFCRPSFFSLVFTS